MIKTSFKLGLLFLSYQIAAATLTCPPLDAQGQRRIDSQAIAILEQCVKAAPATKSLYFHWLRQVYVSCRQRLHEQIVNTLLANAPSCTRQPIAIFTGGIVSSGKTTYREKHLPWVNAKNFLIIDPDDIREKLPEYQGWNAGATQAEVEDIALLILNKIDQPCPHNFLYDSILFDEHFFQQFIAKLQHEGYQVYIVYVQTPESIARERALHRYVSTGRYIENYYWQHKVAQSQMSFNQLKDQVNGYIIVDGMTDKIIAKKNWHIVSAN